MNPAPGTRNPEPTKTDAISAGSILSALSYALDLTEGHPRGHSARTCLIGMALGRAIGLTPEQERDLFYALLLKDAGCSSNAERVFELFGGDDQIVKRGAWEYDWRSMAGQAEYARRYVDPNADFFSRVRKMASLAFGGRSTGRSIFKIRCDRGAEIAYALGFSKATAEAIRSMDEHWDGGGYPYGLQRDAIPMLGRIIGVAQIAEINAEKQGAQHALGVIRQRSGKWFDPEIVSAFGDVAKDRGLWTRVASKEIDREVAAVEPEQLKLDVDEGRLDQIATAFAWVVDAKTSFTFHHSDRVAELSVAIGRHLGMSDAACTRLRRAGLLHDIGKLAVPNRILNKPGKLTEQDWEVVRLHPYYSYQILERVPVFNEFAFDASAHHERLDGRGYYRNLRGDQLSTTARILATADKFDALSADRPYRPGLPLEKVMGILSEEAGKDLCPSCVEAVGQIAILNR